jgi:hypothetical protein
MSKVSLDLKNTTRCRGNAGEFKPAKKVVVLGACTLTLYGTLGWLLEYWTSYAGQDWIGIQR